MNEYIYFVSYFGKILNFELIARFMKFKFLIWNFIKISITFIEMPLAVG